MHAGKRSEDGSVSGTWNIPGERGGNFIARPAKDVTSPVAATQQPPSTSTSATKMHVVWTGQYFEADGSSVGALVLEFDIDGSTVRGGGKDNFGTYTWTGKKYIFSLQDL